MAKGQKQQKGGRNKFLPARLTEKEIEMLRIAKKEKSFADFIVYLYDFWSNARDLTAAEYNEYENFVESFFDGENMNKRLIELVKEEFEKLIAAKTGWGKNEIMRAFDAAIANATLRYLDEVKP